MGSSVVLPMSLVPNTKTNLLVSETMNAFWYSGTLDAPESADTGMPLGEICVTPDCVPEVLIDAPPGVRDRLKVLDVKYLV
jgi:hypothetical protein